jgi:hypothetical protein
MADFRTKILGLAGIVLAFAGVANAQDNCNTGAVGVTPPYALTVPEMRAEGTTELIGDITFTCPATLNAPSLLTVTINGTTTITSKTGVNMNTSEVALVITQDGIPVSGSPFYGTVSGSSVTFTYTPPLTTPMGAPLVYTIENIRVNASTLPTGNSPVTANVVANTGSISLVATNITVGFIATSLKAPSLTTVKGTATGQNTGTVNPKTLVACIGNPSSNGFSFSFDIAEAFPGAFKVQGPLGTVGSESGPDATATEASSGTRFVVTISGIASGVTAYLPTTITSTTGLMLTAIISPTVAAAGGNNEAAASGTGIPTVGGTTFVIGDGPDTYGGLYAPTVSGTTATAYYEVTSSVPTASESANVPVWLVAAPGKVTTAGAVTVVLGYAQTGAIPNFVATTLPALTASQIGLCNTVLLFPYVTTLAGFETGIAISNTSTDPFGTGGAAAETGSCQLSFYGTTGLTTPYTPSSTPLLAPITTTNGTSNMIPSGQTAGFAVSTLAGGPGVNFDGYLIAQCSFQYGHGLAYLLANPSTPGSSYAMGYLALVIPDPTENGGRSTDLVVSEALEN